MEILSKALLFLIQIIFDFYILILLLRMLLQYSGVGPYNPLWNFIVKITQPIVAPLQRYIPTYKSIDYATLILAFVFELIKLIITFLLKLGIFPHLFGLFMLVFAELAQQTLNIFFYSIIIVAIVAWVSPMTNSPLIDILTRLTEPLLRPVRRYIPLLVGLDLSPLVVLVILQLIDIVLFEPLMLRGLRLGITGF